MNRRPLIPGFNVDKLNIEAGMAELVKCGYPVTETRTHWVISYALYRWAHGEETHAQRAAVDQSFHGIDLTSWLRVLSAAKAAVNHQEVEHA